MDLTPKQIVHELNKYIIGQDEAKKAVAIALRNRYRRSMLSPELREEVTPKNIIMKGPTGVGKTEIARRLAKLVKAPFLKVEATKYTEVGYVGRDVESMVRDLAECAMRLVKEEKTQEVSFKAMAVAERRIAKVLAEVKKDERGEYCLKAVYRKRIGSIVFAEVMASLYTEYNSTRNFYVHSAAGGQTKVINDKNQAVAIYENMLAVVEYNAKKLREIGFTLKQQ